MALPPADVRPLLDSLVEIVARAVLADLDHEQSAPDGAEENLR